MDNTLCASDAQLRATIGHVDFQKVLDSRTVARERKATPIYSGVVAYFPDALAAVAQVSKVGNDQHNPGTPLHWDRSKSSDEYDACQRHLVDRAAGDEFDTDGQRHMAKVAWRGLAALQKEIEWQREYDARVLNGEDEIRGHTFDTWVRTYKTTSAAKVQFKNSKSQKIAPPYATRKDCTGDPACLTDSGRQAQWRDALVEESRRQVAAIRKQHEASAESVEGYIESLQSCGEEDCK